MPTLTPNRKPGFFWQGALILLPVAVLAAIGIWTFRMDRVAMEGDARRRAESLAATTLANLETFFQQLQMGPATGFGSRDRLDTFFVGPDNKLSGLGPDWPPKPAPLSPDPVAGLGPIKAEQWGQAEAAFAKRDWRRAADLYEATLEGRRELARGNEPGPLSSERNRFLALAFYRRGYALEQLGETNSAVEAYNGVLSGARVGEPVTESGLGLSALCALKVLNLTHDDAARLPEEWRRNPLGLGMRLEVDGSPFGLECYARLKGMGTALTSNAQPAVTPEMIFSVWDNILRSRQRYEEAAGVRAGDPSPWPAMFWVMGDLRWLAVKQNWPAEMNTPPVNQVAFVVFSEGTIAEILGRARRERGEENFAMSAVIGGRALGPASGRFAATAESASMPLAVTASLQNPAAFFAGQQRRQWLFSGLLLASALAALGGYFAARRAFYRQLRLNEMKSDFVSSVSHELRAPIASVRLMAEGLEGGRVKESEKQQEYFGFIVQECRRLSSLIENVLDFSRIEQGRKQYEMESTDLEALTKQTVKLMETYAAEWQIALKFQSNGTPVPVELDGKAMQQALINLIDNALKHSPKGSAVEIGLEYAPSKVQLWVHDKGEGIHSSEHEKIFERFYRVGSELRRETQGVGIGLSIVKHIVEAHAGIITVQSAPGKGSKFTIELQVHK